MALATRRASPLGRSALGTRLVALLLPVMLATGHGRTSAGSLAAGELTRLQRRARAVTIYRDRYGVPHVHGRTDADAVFGMAYAYAEDRFPEMEPYFYRALGRAAEAEGEGGLPNDIMLRALEVERLSREEYRSADTTIRALADGFADGMNLFLAEHPDVTPRLLRRFEPWHVFAFYRALGLNPDLVGLDPGSLPGLVRASGDETIGSNMWAVSGAKSASGHPMLFLNPHTPMAPVYELHLMSDEGWSMTGMNAYSMTAVPVMGHNQHLGWALTVNYPDYADAWLETFDRADDSLAYRYGEGYRRATVWYDTVRVRTSSGVEARRIRLLKTHHGPILAVRDGKQLAVRFAGLERGGLLQQWYAMGKASNLAEFREALDIQGLVFHNVMYADTAGNTFYVFNGLIPRRDQKYDWTKPVDGSDPGTEWQGYHPLAEVPWILNPPAGWLQNTNSTPFLATAHPGNPNPAGFPKYVAPEPDNWRARASRRLLARQAKFTFEEWARLAFDTYFLAADSVLPLLFHEWDLLGALAPGRADSARDLIDGLRAWDRRGAVGSEAAAWFVLLVEGLRERAQKRDTASWGRVGALEDARAHLVRRFGSWRVSLGDLQRLQRRSERSAERFSDDRPSLPLPTGNGNWLGSIFTVGVESPDGLKRRYAVSGSAYVSVVEFGPQVRALSVVPYGQSGDPSSPHYFDQAPLFASGRFKPSWFTMDEIRANLEQSYRPGDERRRR
jgi:acyl-homoserine lactone acylase PvdQ